MSFNNNNYYLLIRRLVTNLYTYTCTYTFLLVSTTSKVLTFLYKCSHFCYSFLFRHPRYLGIGIFLVCSTLAAYASLVIFMLGYAFIIDHPWDHIPYGECNLNELTYLLILDWIKGFRIVWMDAAITYSGPEKPLSPYAQYFFTFICYGQNFPKLACFNIFFIAYFSLGLSYISLILYALIIKNKALKLKFNAYRTLGFIAHVSLIMVLFVWCPPMYGFGLVPSIHQNIFEPLHEAHIILQKVYPAISSEVETELANASLETANKSAPPGMASPSESFHLYIFLLNVLTLVGCCLFVYIAGVKFFNTLRVLKNKSKMTVRDFVTLACLIACIILALALIYGVVFQPTWYLCF